MQSGYDLSQLIQEAQVRWLKPPEVLFILQNHKDHQLTDKPPQRPSSGSLFLFNKRVLRFFRKDGHSWRRKRDGRTISEAHERLKVGNAEALNCYYAHGDLNPNFQRRSYWMLDPGFEHIVLVHYRDITEGRHNGDSVLQLSPESYATLSHVPSSNTTQFAGSTDVISDLHDPYHSASSPGSMEVSSNAIIKSDSMNYFDMRKSTEELNTSPNLEINKALRRLEEQLSLNDDSVEQMGLSYPGHEDSKNIGHAVCYQSLPQSAVMQDDLNSLMLQQCSGEKNKEHYYQQFGDGFSINEEAAAWNGMLDCFTDSAGVGQGHKHVKISNGNAIVSPSPVKEPSEEQDISEWINFDAETPENSSNVLSQEAETFRFSAPPHAMNYYEANPYQEMFQQDQIGVPLQATPSSTISINYKFTLHEISPDWGYANETTKVIIIGSFVCDPSDHGLTCKFGDIEVPIEIIQEGVIRCHAPPNLPGKVTLCITSGNHESCSEFREFEYRVNPSSWHQSNVPKTEKSTNLEELLLLVRLVQMLLSDSPVQKIENSRSDICLLDKVKAGEESWTQVIEALLVGTWTSSSTKDWLLEELLKEKMCHWLSSRLLEGSDHAQCFLSKKEQGIIHMVSGLGFEWALNAILDAGVSVDFRDINGWTALHWAARFGREKMVAELLASGASAGALTDPYSQDPTGKTPASIAASCGHKGLAGYLSEVSLTSHLSSLTMAESEQSKNSAEVETERTLDSLSNTNLTAVDHQLPLKQTLAAVRNASQAAARIQSAFRAHSFRKRQAASTTATDDSGDAYSLLSHDVYGLSAASKLAFRNTRDTNAAALSIQKKYRGWKGRKDFLAYRKKVVKIQAHVRGHQVRKNYKVICWAVGVLEKVVLRWRRRRSGLRGFRPEAGSIDEVEDEDIVKVFRKQKVDVAIDEALLRVRSMVNSEEAREQYHRMLEKYGQAKAKLEGSTSEASTSSEISNMENDGGI
ncbi:calmodulin-binding transcription activator 4 [Daucus carota subsp. sativus]|uniref:calmodulin-binding transcription activator 4 n=1 Tax=Daucus carota subsp. sativus TaxID=79200 RepID=UPI0007EF5DCD|nr:PREDICTED: calmodulin-binding transcription activator 4-like [Daucus carota subsp. sativus]